MARAWARSGDARGPQGRRRPLPTSRAEGGRGTVDGRSPFSQSPPSQPNAIQAPGHVRHGAVPAVPPQVSRGRVFHAPSSAVCHPGPTRPMTPVGGCFPSIAQRVCLKRHEAAVAVVESRQHQSLPDVTGWWRISRQHPPAAARSAAEPPSKCAPTPRTTCGGSFTSRGRHATRGRQPIRRQGVLDVSVLGRSSPVK